MFKNADHQDPFDAGLFRGLVIGAVVGVYLWEWSKSLEEEDRVNA